MSKEPMRTIVVTGGSGFVGAHFLRHLRGRFRLVALSRHPLATELLEGVEYLHQDLTQPLNLEALPKRPDAIVHLAQSRRYREFPDGNQDMFSVNLQATFNLLEYARQAEAGGFVFASTGGVYGYGDRPWREADPANPPNFYHASKYAAELLVEKYAPLFPTVILRPFFVYGPGQTGMLIPSLLERVRRGETIALEGEPGLRINPLHVSDLVAMLEAVLGRQDSGTFNAAGGEVLSLTELVRLMGQVLGRVPTITYRPQAQAGDLVGDNQRMIEVLGIRPATTLEAGLREMAGGRVS